MSDITDMCRTGGLIKLWNFRLNNVFFINLDENRVILLDILRRFDPTAEDHYDELVLSFKRVRINANGDIEEVEKTSSALSVSNLYNSVPGLWTFINSLIKQTKSTEIGCATWAKNLYTILSGLRKNLWKGETGDGRVLTKELKKQMTLKKEEYDTYIDFLARFQDLCQDEWDVKEKLKFYVGCLLKLKELGDYLYIVENSMQSLRDGISTEAESKANNKAVIMTSDKGLPMSALLFPSQLGFNIGNHVFATQGPHINRVGFGATRGAPSSERHPSLTGSDEGFHIVTNGWALEGGMKGRKSSGPRKKKKSGAADDEPVDIIPMLNWLEDYMSNFDSEVRKNRRT